MRVAILGAGPSGLIAAHAASMLGHETKVFSQYRKSEMFGCQYLHTPIAGLVGENDGQDVSYQLTGTTSQYRDKVYGPAFRGRVSPEDLVGEHRAWNLRSAYDKLWHKWQDNIMDTDVRDEVFMEELLGYCDQVISTVPMPVLCTGRHQFVAQEVWAIGDAPERGVRVPYRAPEFTVLCNGDKEPGWYRAANVFGYGTLEWPALKANSKPPISGVALVKKPTWTDCTCHADIETFNRVGRYGAWKKGKLVSDVWQDVSRILT